MDSRKAYSPLRHGPAFFSACSTRISSRNDPYANQTGYQSAPWGRKDRLPLTSFVM